MLLRIGEDPEALFHSDAVMAISTMEFATTEGNRIAVSGETTNLDAYMKVFNSQATAEAMALDGHARDNRVRNLRARPVIVGCRVMVKRTHVLQ